MIQNTVYQLKISEGEEEAPQARAEDETAGETAIEGPSQTVSKTYHYHEGQDKGYLAKADGYLKFYHVNVAIQRASIYCFVTVTGSIASTIYRC